MTTHLSGPSTQPGQAQSEFSQLNERRCADRADVAIFIPSLGEGGIERVYLNLVYELMNRGVRVDLLVARAVGTRLSSVPLGARLIDLGARRRGMLSVLPGFLCYLWRTRPKVLLACSGINLPAIWARLLLGPKLRVVVAVHNTLSVQFASLKLYKRILVPPLLAMFYPKADAIIAVSNGVADDLHHFLRINRKSIKVIYNPIVNNDMVNKMEAPFEHHWFCETEPPVVIGIGSLIARKDFATLLRAFAIVRQHCQARLMILGEGEERPHLEQLIRELRLEGEVELPGFVSNPYPYLRRAKLFVLSSRWEGLPTNVVEALACGCPVVATDCPSGPAEILENGRYGRLVPVGDVEAIAWAIRDALAESSGSEPLRQRAMDFHVDRVVERYQEVLEL